MEINKYFNDYIELLNSFNTFFFVQSRILNKEIKTLALAVEYYKIEGSESQEYFELARISDGLDKLETISLKFINQFTKDTKKGEFVNLIDNIKLQNDNNHIAILINIDSRINLFKNHFDELYFYKQSYYNLTNSKEFSYIPSPKFNKRFRNANLGLYLNKQLNDTDKKMNSYRNKVSDFYELNGLATSSDIVNFRNTNFFATWSYSTDPYIKNFSSRSEENNKENIYISMSYAYLDKTIFQPIAYHEISHSMNHIELNYLDKKYLEQSLLPFKGLHFFVKDDPIDELYKEILCDLSAMYATGYSYLMSLIHIGFFQLSTFFSNSKNITNIELSNVEDITPLNFDFSINNINLAVRLYLLLELCEQLEIDNTYVRGVRYLLNILFPEYGSDIKQTTFLSIYKFISPNIKHYQMSLNLIESLSTKFSDIILTKKLVNSFKSKSSSPIFVSFKNKISSKSNTIKSITGNIQGKCSSIYDLLWTLREYNYNPKNSSIITEREINRLFNIYSIFYADKSEVTAQIELIFDKILKNLFTDNKNLFVDLEYIKYKATKNFHPYVHFFDYIKKADNCKIHYILAPYDIALFREVSIDSPLHNSYPFSEYKYFVDRHSLFLLHEIVIKDINSPVNKNERGYSTIVEIKLNNIFSSIENIEFLTFLYDYIEKKKHLFNKCQIFKSLGGEDYILYVEGISINDVRIFGKYIQSQYLKTQIEIEDLILLTDRNKLNPGPNSDPNFEIVSFAKINKKHTKAHHFFDYIPNDDIIDFLPSKGTFFDEKIPTNRFDYIINWKINSRVIPEIKNYLKKTYYNNCEVNFFSDFNIEVMHKQVKHHREPKRRKVKPRKG